MNDELGVVHFSNHGGADVSQSALGLTCVINDHFSTTSQSARLFLLFHASDGEPGHRLTNPYIGLANVVIMDCSMKV